MLNKESKIYLAGHRGLVGSSILKKLKNFGYKNIIVRTRHQLDLRDQKKVMNFFKKNSFQYVIIAAAKVGGIYANDTYKADFIYENLVIQNNIIHSSFVNGIKNIIFLGSSCIYPKNSKQPIKESYLLTGELEKTNEPYAVAKIAGIKLCESFNSQYGTNYKCLMPSNIYGPNDNYNLKSSHFFPALIAKTHDAIKKNKKELVVWGSGQPKRELMYSEDLADACLFFLKKKTKETLINIGSSKERTISEYARFIIKKFDTKLKLKFDRSKKDGMKRKILDCSIAKKYGWKPKYSLDYGFEKTYKDFLKKI
ncbi:GDP-L-fucose synthase [Candidatus Pelagibacter sp.]|nr:GDP-L-fucose synthase [Candidatus Pelagibacter sp.]